MEFYPKHQPCRGVQIDAEPSRLGLRFPIDVGLCGDARATLQALLPHITRRSAFLERAQAGMKAWRELLRTQAAREEIPMKPQVIVAALN
jgi:pyruvate dehydrogenase (quinone)